ncbi:MAG: sigma-70 family RNA polymerase sigma factor [Steroidobacteraceae bacterium]
MTAEQSSAEDRRARFDAQVLPHLDAAYRFARWLTRSPADADDVVQEAMLRAWRGFDGLRGGDVKAWLFAIVRNCHLTGHARRERRGFVPLPEEGDPQHAALVSQEPGPEADSMRRDEERSLARLLEELPLEHREVLILREIEELDYRAIASVTQMPIGTVMSRLARARAALKARWSMRTEEERDAVR